MGSKVLIALFITLAVASAKPKIGNIAEDAVQERLFFSNFWIPLPFVPTRQPAAAAAAATTTVAPAACTPATHGAVAMPLAATAICSCGTNAAVCPVGAYCVVTAGTGACTPVPPLACAAGSTLPCLCGATAATQLICTTTLTTCVPATPAC